MHFPGHANQRNRSALALPVAALIAALALFASPLAAAPSIGLCQFAQADLGRPARLGGAGANPSISTDKIDTASVDTNAEYGAAVAAPSSSSSSATSEPYAAPAAWLAAGVAPAFGLKFDPILNLEPSAVGETPLYIFGKNISGQTDDWFESEGDAEFRRQGIFIKGDRVRHDLVRDEVFAQGQVKLFREGEFYEGAALRLKLGTTQGRFEDVQYQLISTGGRGTAASVEFIQPLETKLTQATYTTCSRDRPTWELRMNEMVIDQIREVADSKSAVLYWGSVPVLPLGDTSFPAGEGRKSGLLPPNFGVSTKLGVDVQAPFYWNMASHHDLTLTPRLMSKRGTQLGSEFRFLREDSIGVIRYDVLPSDKSTNETRQFGSVSAAYRPIPDLTLGLNVQRASDNNYFSDFGNSLLASSQRLLPGHLTLATNSRGWNVAAEVQHYQLLQDAASPLIQPYAVEPRVAVSRSHRSVRGEEWPLDWDARAELASFRHPTLEDGDRFVAAGSLAWRHLQNGFYFTPKLSLHATQYWQRDIGSADGTNTKYGTSPSGTIYEYNVDAPKRNYSRMLPTLSLDFGTALERDFSVNGRSFEQTLEPRLLYIYTPYKDQSKYPVFDTGAPNLNYAQMFSDTAFNGSDRIADLDQLTAGVITRLNDQQSGAELFRAGVAQRFYFSDQRVTLPGVATRTDRKSDFLAQIVARPIKNLTLDGQLQYTPSSSTWQSATLVSRYTPKPASNLSVAYRFVRDSSNTVDVAFQWPISQFWYAVGRYQHAFKDSNNTSDSSTFAKGTNLVEALAGFEYDGGCWIGRFVVQQYAVSASQKNAAFFFQIELNGLGRLGTGSISTLTRNIPNYQLINQVTPLPSKFDNFQ